MLRSAEALLGIGEALISSSGELKSPSILKLFLHGVDCSRREGQCGAGGVGGVGSWLHFPIMVRLGEVKPGA